MGVVVFADTKDGKLVKSSFEAITYAAKIGAGSVTAVTYGDADAGSLAELGAFGASKVIVARSVSQMDSQKLARLIGNVATDEGADMVIMAHDFTGKSLAGRVAVRLNAALVSGAVALPDDGTVKKAVFSGKAFAHAALKADKKVISVLPNSIPAERTGSPCEVADYSGDLGTSTLTVKGFTPKGGDGVPLPEADLVVSAGRGLKGPENWGMVESLAQELGAATACSRPVADIGWRPHHEHVGQTGVAVRPNLYIAIGISGAIQHLAGVNQSKTIVVINTDPEAPFFKAADYGIVGDAFEVVPKLVEAVKNFKSQLN